LIFRIIIKTVATRSPILLSSSILKVQILRGEKEGKERGKDRKGRIRREKKETRERRGRNKGERGRGKGGDFRSVHFSGYATAADSFAELFAGGAVRETFYQFHIQRHRQLTSSSSSSTSTFGRHVSVWFQHARHSHGGATL